MRREDVALFVVWIYVLSACCGCGVVIGGVGAAFVDLALTALWGA